MRSKFFIAGAVEFNTDPATHPHIGRTEERRRRTLDQHPLETWRRGYPHRNVPVVVVIVGEHGEYFLADEEGWFSVRKLFCALRHGGADAPDSPQVLLAVSDFLFPLMIV